MTPVSPALTPSTIKWCQHGLYRRLLSTASSTFTRLAGKATDQCTNKNKEEHDISRVCMYTRRVLLYFFLFPAYEYCTLHSHDEIRFIFWVRKPVGGLSSRNTNSKQDKTDLAPRRGGGVEATGGQLQYRTRPSPDTASPAQPRPPPTTYTYTHARASGTCARKSWYRRCSSRSLRSRVSSSCLSRHCFLSLAISCSFCSRCLRSSPARFTARLRLLSFSCGCTFSV